MGILASLRTLFGRNELVAAAADTYAVDRSSIPAQIFGLESYEDPIAAAPRVPRALAIQVPAVKKIRDLICPVIGRLPLEVYDADYVRLVNDLLPQPERNKPRIITMTNTIEDMVFEGIAWWRVVERAWDGYPRYVKRIDPWRVSVDEHKGVVYVDGEHVPDKDLIRFDSPNDPLLVAGARAIRICLKLDRTAGTYADHPQAREYFVPAENADEIDDDEVRDMLREWEAARRDHATGYIPAALDLKQGQLLSPKDLQLADARQHAVLELARAGGVDPEELGVSTTSRTYANTFDRRKQYTDFTLGAYMGAVEERLSMADVTKRGNAVRFSLDDFQRSSRLQRFQEYEIGVRVGAMTADEIRTEERKPTLTEDQMPAPASTSTTPPVQASRFDAGAVQFTAPPAAAAFKVNREARTIKGLALPFGKVGSTRGYSWVFTKDSVVIPDDVTRVKLLLDHSYGEAIGYASAIDVDDEGLWPTFKIARGDAGDRALTLAEDKVYDGLSVGLGYGGELDVIDGEHYTYTAAPLLEISLTPLPAFADARVTAVAASAAQKGTDMKCDKCGQALAPGHTCDPVHVAAFAKTQTPPAPSTAQPAPAAQTFTAEEREQLLALLGKGKAPDGPQVISASDGGTGRVQVQEEAPYRFARVPGTGQYLTLPSKHDFSRDLFAASRGDVEAQKRSMAFITDAFKPGGIASKFDVDTNDVTALNPTRQRPDMYVDQKAYVTPFYDALFKGTLADQTPFTFPKFSSATGLVAAHVQGVEPTPGTFVATNQTVTPSAMSGKVEITREVYDAGGNPQVSGLIWNKMVRAWYEAMEAAAVAVLDAASPTAIALAAGAADATLVNALEAAIAALQFIRGGNTFNFAGTHQDLYLKLAAAVDSTGRKLLPRLGPTNANGSSEARFAMLDVAGVPFAPAWSLGASGSVVESSYLVDTNDVHVWNTAPQRLEFQYRVAYVDLAIWGYTAAAISDLSGVREITYDPVP